MVLVVLVMLGEVVVKVTVLILIVVLEVVFVFCTSGLLLLMMI